MAWRMDAKSSGVAEARAAGQEGLTRPLVEARS